MRPPARAAMTLCLALTGCASVPDATAAAGLARSAPFTYVDIDNRSWSAVTVYAVRDGMRRRLGVAEAASTTSFRLPARFRDHFGRVQLQAVPDGIGAGITTDALPVADGQRVMWTLQSRLEQSSVGVW